MHKKDRKLLLERMLKANDEMSNDKPTQAFEYVRALIELCNSIEYNHANAIWKYENALEHQEESRQQWGQYIINLQQADLESDKLEQVIKYYEVEVESLFEASENGYKYFLKSDQENN